MDACQHSNFKGPLSCAPPPAPLSTHRSILYLFEAVTLPNQVAKALEKMDTVSGPTGLQGVEMPAGFSLAQLGWWDPSTGTA